MAQGDYGTLVPPWRVGPSREIARTRVFTLNEHRCESPATGRSGDYVFLDTADWCNVAALTPDGQVVMIEQFRHGLAEVTLELPGGIVDPGESPAAACERELLEETGYAGAPVEMIGVVSANPAMQNNRVHTGLVRHGVLRGSQHLDGSEEIAVRLVKLTDVPDLVSRGVIHHSLVVAAFYHLALRG